MIFKHVSGLDVENFWWTETHFGLLPTSFDRSLPKQIELSVDFRLSDMLPINGLLDFALGGKLLGMKLICRLPID